MAGRIGLATAGSILPAGSGAFAAGQTGGGGEEAAEVVAQERRIDALAAGELPTEEGLAAGEAAEVEAEAEAGAGVEVEVEVGAGVEAEEAGEVEVEEEEAGEVEEEEEEAGDHFWRGGEERLGRGVRQGLLRVPMPGRLRHSMCVCRREGDKGAVVSALLREQQAVRRRRGEAEGAGSLLQGGQAATEEGGISEAGRVLLLVRGGLPLADVVEELEVSSRRGNRPLHPSAPGLCTRPLHAAFAHPRPRLPALARPRPRSPALARPRPPSPALARPRSPSPALACPRLPPRSLALATTAVRPRPPLTPPPPAQELGVQAAELTSVMVAAQQEQQEQQQQAAAAVLEQGGEDSEEGTLPEWARPYTPRKKQDLPRPATLFGRTVQEGLPAGAASGGGDSAAAAVLVAHEHAIRGIDLPQVDLVIVTMLPDSTESYMHMAGRTGRAGRPGDAVCIFTEQELQEAGALTRALRVRWRTRRWSDDGGFERWGKSSARSTASIPS